MRKLRPGALYLSHEELDVSVEEDVRNACDGRRTIVHLAAYTDVDGCEREPERAFAVNANGARHVARAAEATNARLIFLSTDYVFGGDVAGEYGEDDAPNPLNTYGTSKLEGEKAALEVREALVIRSSTVFGEGRNFVRSIVELGKHQEELRVVADQISRPTPAADLARALWFLVEHSDISGVLHVAGQGRPCSRAELAEQALAAADVRAKVWPVDTASFVAQSDTTQAPRPLNSTLSLARATDLGVPLFPWIDGLRSYVGSLV
jgi:dTDP-4-dehydrorhamnose reductase